MDLGLGLTYVSFSLPSPFSSKCLHASTPKINLLRPRFASVKAADIPQTTAPKRVKSTPASVQKNAPPLVTKGASALAKDAFNDAATKTPTSKSPPQNTLPPPPTEEDASSAPLPPPTPAVGIWLMSSAVLVLVVVVVGGITRLTESGLSITEWRPITGVVPPLSKEAWDKEFEKYKATPEFKMLNHSMTVDEFKRIFYMEWGHRILGRLIGLTFVVPLAYFTATKKISKPLALKLSGLGLLIGAQGALGWYMVRSGLEDSLLETPGAVPRVSHYRLAAHLSMAFALYLGMFSTGMAIIKDWRFVRTGSAGGLPLASFDQALNNPLVKRFKSLSWVLTGLVLLTALSGVFVAGLDAGLIYNEWPLMAGGLAPPADELLSPTYAQNPDKSDLWRNFFDNPSLVQFDHRMLATSTYAGMAFLFAQTMRPAWRSVIPPLALTSARAAFAMANVQVLLGITTLLYMVPVPLAAAHQGGSILLLSAMLQLLIALRRPGAAARAWRTWKTSKVPPVA
ncbi:Electron transfer protein 1 [Mycena indigotica]|uniref:Electron transfer protein 1 n=1 Tax=Mycena indigotica TaxID=2126181 RepID=A0A8H6SMF9_9AGAR|nr:Electron transfer protein 1 [Mycena indigotica]KAF7301545.1 Electron transfer protein 1 [Mycena indigotica]